MDISDGHHSVLALVEEVEDEGQVGGALVEMHTEPLSGCQGSQRPGCGGKVCQTHCDGLAEGPVQCPEALEGALPLHNNVLALGQGFSLPLPLLLLQAGLGQVEEGSLPLVPVLPVVLVQKLPRVPHPKLE
eukprot:1109890-Lingulodinium_polyedra.AAC.1